jgi:hypothetical protein
MISTPVRQLSAGTLVRPVRRKRRLKVHNPFDDQAPLAFTDLSLVQVLGEL